MAHPEREPHERPGTARRRGREVLLRALYQADVCGDALAATWEAAVAEERLPSEAGAYAAAVCRAVQERGAEVDAAVRRCLEHWSFERLAAIDRAVLRLAVTELVAMPATPARVVLDQAVEIATKFGGAESGPFVNGLLDRVAREVRPGELEAEAATQKKGPAGRRGS
jgi:transcription antitermination protein NusB